MDKNKIERYFLNNYSNDDKLYVEELFCNQDIEQDLWSFLEDQWYDSFKTLEVDGVCIDNLFNNIIHVATIKQERE